MAEINTEIIVSRFQTNQDDIIVLSDYFSNTLKITRLDNFDLYRVVNYAYKQYGNALTRTRLINSINYFKSYDNSHEDYFSKETNISSLISNNKNIAIRNFKYLDSKYDASRNYFEIFKFSSNKDFSGVSAKLAPDVYLKILSSGIDENYLNTFVGVIELTGNDMKEYKNKVITAKIDYDVRLLSDDDIEIKSEVTQEIVKLI